MYTASTSPQPLNVVSTEKLARFGTMYEDEIGRVFRYCRAGATALVGGTVCVMPATQASSWVRTLQATNFANDAVATYGNTVGVSLGTAPTENQWVDGIVGYGRNSTGLVQSASIAGHTNGSTSAAFFVDQRAPRGTTVDAAGSVRSGVTVSPYNGVVASPTDIATPPVCVAQFPVAANGYFWGLVRGLGIAAMTGTCVAGDMVMLSTATAGSVTAYILTVPAGTDAAGGTLTPAQQFPIGWAINPDATYADIGTVLFNLP